MKCLDDENTEHKTTGRDKAQPVGDVGNDLWYLITLIKRCRRLWRCKGINYMFFLETYKFKDVQDLVDSDATFGAWNFNGFEQTIFTLKACRFR